MSTSIWAAIKPTAAAFFCALAAFGCMVQQAPRPSPTTDQLSFAATATDNEDSRMQLTTFLLFGGDAKGAMEFYHAIFGGDLTVTTVGDSPMKSMFPAEMHARVVNARLKSSLVDISASDWLRPAQNRIQGNTVCLYLSGGSRDETKLLFEKLSDGAEVTDPLRDEPFGQYGALNDRFGNRWMFQSK